MPTDTKKGYIHIIWDWNGTLLNDVDSVVNAMNRLLGKRNLPLQDEEKYKDIFTFPVRNYYEKLGFDFDSEPFETLASEFVSEFQPENYLFQLHQGAEEVLKTVQQLGISQSILSASKEQELRELVAQLHIDSYFVRVVGLDNHYAGSKVERGKELLADLGLEPAEVLLIGDTIHDYEVSREIGCDCLLIAGGHQSYRRLLECNTGIVESVSEVIGFIRK